MGRTVRQDGLVVQQKNMNISGCVDISLSFPIAWLRADLNKTED
jgi:hypothetical protein